MLDDRGNLLEDEEDELEEVLAAETKARAKVGGRGWRRSMRTVHLPAQQAPLQACAGHALDARPPPA
jgi:hypothetical protein